MRIFPAQTVYVDPQVYERDNCRHRLERVLPSIGCDDIREYDAEARAHLDQIGKRRHGKDDFGAAAVVVFRTFDESRRSWHYNWRDEAARHGGACQPGMQLNLVDGCVFRCAYCGFGRKIAFWLDVEQFVEGLDQVFADHPTQRLYKFSNTTDLPPFEPELDAIPPMVERFAGEADRYLMLFTKSDNVAFLGDLDHRGHTIVSWSLTCDTTSRLVDRGTPSLEERLEAMARAQAAGYLVRARLSPIVPVRNWREEYADLFARLFARVSPDVVTLELLGWMSIDDLTAILDLDLLDADMVEEARSEAELLSQAQWGPFTQAAHEEVYGFCVETARQVSPSTPISVCHGTPRTWDALEGRMEMTPSSYLCNCGPITAPGGVLYDSWSQKGRAAREGSVREPAALGARRQS